jgi:hypothetical protein
MKILQACAEDPKVDPCGTPILPCAEPQGSFSCSQTPPLGTTLRELKAVHIFTPDSSKIHFNIIHQGGFFPTKILYAFLLSPRNDDTGIHHNNFCLELPW